VSADDFRKLRSKGNDRARAREPKSGFASERALNY
jgi:hypothetical protein